MCPERRSPKDSRELESSVAKRGAKRQVRRRREALEAKLKSAREGSSPLVAGPTGEEPEDLQIEEEDDDELSVEERESLESRTVGSATSAETIGELESELATVKELEHRAQTVRAADHHGKWDELAALLQSQPELFDAEGHRRKLIVFTEHRDTLTYLETRIGNLLGRPESVVTIHGGMSRDDRRFAQDRFVQDKDVMVLVATDAAGEGVNLQRAHLMVNYDIPWNPNRLEQRFGRIHRIGQTEVCHMWNLVAKDTREGAVLERLFEKLESERLALGGRVFDILGRAIEARDLRDLMIEAIRYGDQPDVRNRLFSVVDAKLDRGRIQALLEEHALAHETMDPARLSRVREYVERAEARRLQPHFVQAFFVRAFRTLGGSLHERETGRFELTHVPASVRSKALELGRAKRLLQRYERITFEKNLT
jgi:hypothetical protein